MCSAEYWYETNLKELQIYTVYTYTCLQREKKSLAKRKKITCKEEKKKSLVRNGIQTHAHISGPDLESGALDRSATLTANLLGYFLLFDLSVNQF